MLIRLLLLTALLILPVACNLTSDSDGSTAVPPSAIPGEQMPLVYYYFPALAGNTFPAGSVVIVPDALILSPTLSNIPRSADPAANVQGALQAMLNDPRNVWTGSVTISSVTVNAGQAVVDLSGDISGTGDAVLIAARWQFLLTVFAEASIQSAVVTLNGQNIGDLGISHSSEARTTDAYSRAEVESFMAENAFPVP